MKRTSFLMAMLCASLWCAAARAGDPPSKEKDADEKAADLAVGSKAPALTIDKWVKGSEVDLSKAKPDDVYVVEFWATWCGPCKMSIPHLSEMQKHFKSKGVTFVGVSNEKVDVVKKFLDNGWDAKMQYTVAVDKDGKTSEHWMEAAGQNGIPTAFLVKGGKITFIGNPLVDPLDEEVAKACGDKEYAENAKAYKKNAKALKDAIGEEEWDDALKAIDKMSAMKPDESGLAMTKYMILATKKKDKDAAAKAGAAFVAKTDDPQMLNQVAWGILTDDDFEGARDIKLAKTAAKKAVDLTKEKDPAILDTLARALADDGDIKGAVEVQKKAIAMCGNDEKNAEMKEELEKNLKGYETR